MDFSLSDEQRMFQDMFRDFAQNEVLPLAERLDREERPPLETLKKAAGLDLLGIPLPEQYGGMNAGLLAYGLLLEELGKVCLSTAVSLGVHCGAAMAVAAGGSEEQKQRFLPRMAGGEHIAAWALAEPDAGADIRMLATNARADGDHYILNGCKSQVINGDSANVLVVCARCGSELAMFVVPKAAPGLTIGWRDKQMGLRGASGAAIFFTDCRIPGDSRLSAASAEAIISKVSRFSRLGLAFACLGISERGLADSAAFAVSRQQFGGPIAAKQTIQGYLADMATQIETLRHLAYYTACRIEQDKASEADLAMLKLWAGQAATWVINKAVQVHGGMGYIKSFHVERLYRDVRAMSILEGSNESQRLAVASSILRPLGLEVSL